MVPVDDRGEQWHPPSRQNRPIDGVGSALRWPAIVEVEEALLEGRVELPYVVQQSGGVGELPAGELLSVELRKLCCLPQMRSEVVPLPTITSWSVGVIAQ